MAARNGPGSPNIEGARQEMNLGLAAQGQQQAFNNAMGAYQMAYNYAYNPVGQASTQSQINSTTGITNANTLTNQNQNSKQTSVDYGGLLDTAAAGLSGLTTGFSGGGLF